MTSDFITDFMSMTEGQSSPPIFRLWSGIACVAGALERSRVFIRTGGGIINPNQYVMLVAPPGVGKFVIETVRQLWSEVRDQGTRNHAFHVAPDNMTNASMMDELAKAKIVRISSSGPTIAYNSLLLALEELENFLPGYDKQLISSLNSIYNNKDKHKESRRTGSVKELIIENPCFNILTGTQPAYLANTFPEENWKTGLSRRVIMIYCSSLPIKSLFYSPGDVSTLRHSLVKRLGELSTIQTEFQWTEKSAQMIDDWYMGGGKPMPSHSKLENYAQPRNRAVLIIKLAIVSAISRGQYQLLEEIDITRAMSWLFEAEALMPDIFRAMLGKSDRAILEEMYTYMLELWNKQSKKGTINSESLYSFLSSQVPSDKVGKLFEVAEKSGIIRRAFGTVDQFTPGVLKEPRGVE